MANTSSTAPSCQLEPATKYISIAIALPAHANRAISVVLAEDRSAIAPTTGRTSAERMVAAVTR